MKIIGLTGGIGSGKSTASALLKELGCKIIDADQIARTVVEPGKRANQEIRDFFGDDVFLDDGTVNRKELGRVVFSDNDRLEKLNEITHREIVQQIKEDIQEYESIGADLVFIDAALLFETGLHALTDAVWVIDAPEEDRINRIQCRDGLNKDEIYARMASQADPKDLLNRADEIIQNSKGVEELKANLVQLLKKYEA